MSQGFLAQLLDGPCRSPQLIRSAGLHRLSEGLQKEFLDRLQANGWIEPYPFGPFKDAVQLTVGGRAAICT